MSIENSVSNEFFYIRSSKVSTILIVVDLVCYYARAKTQNDFVGFGINHILNMFTLENPVLEQCSHRVLVAADESKEQCTKLLKRVIFWSIFLFQYFILLQLCFTRTRASLE